MKNRLVMVIGMAAVVASIAAVGQAPPASPIPQQPSESPLPGIPASQAPAGMVWGPGREVQAGLMLLSRYGGPDQHTGRYVFAVYVRNRTNRTLTVSCPGFGGLSVPSDGLKYTTLFQSPMIFCTPHLADSNGKPVEMKYKESADMRQFTLAPGELAYLSHWMLRAKDVKSKASSLSSDHQVAFVKPGTYHLRCDVKSMWKGKPDRLGVLLTGVLSFDVTAADLAQ